MTERLSAEQAAIHAYCAGIIDGEGYVGCTRTKPRGTSVSPRFTVRVGLMMADREPVELVASLVGAPVYERDRRAKENHSLMYVMDITSERAVSLLKKVFPYLICKKRQAELACKLQELKSLRGAGGGRLADDDIAQYDALYLAMRRRSVTNNGIVARAL